MLCCCGIKQRKRCSRDGNNSGWWCWGGKWRHSSAVFFLFFLFSKPLINSWYITKNIWQIDDKEGLRNEDDDDDDDKERSKKKEANFVGLMIIISIGISSSSSSSNVKLISKKKKDYVCFFSFHLFLPFFIRFVFFFFFFFFFFAPSFSSLSIKCVYHHHCFVPFLMLLSSPLLFSKPIRCPPVLNPLITLHLFIWISESEKKKKKRKIDDKEAKRNYQLICGKKKKSKIGKSKKFFTFL